MATKKKKKVGIPGVENIGHKTYRIRPRVWNPAEGKYIEKKRIVKNMTEKQALREKLRLEEELSVEAQNQRKEKKDRTLEDFAISWLRGKWPTLTRASRRRYTDCLELHLFPYLGQRRLVDLTEEDIVEWRDEVKARGKRVSKNGKETRKPLADQTVNSFLVIFKSIMSKAARRYGFIDPAFDVPPLSGKDKKITREQPNSLTPDEAAKFLKAAQELFPHHYPLIMVLLTTTARIGSVTVLRREDVRWEEGTIEIKRRRDEGNVVVPGVKGHGPDGFVECPLHPMVAELLKEHIANMTPVQLESGWLFPSATGGLIAKSILDKPFKKILAEVGIQKRFTVHGLRRTGNNFYRQQSSEVVTMSITGHRTQQMHKHYSTVGKEEKLNASRRAFDAIVPGSDGHDPDPVSEHGNIENGPQDPNMGTFSGAQKSAKSELHGNFYGKVGQKRGHPHLRVVGK